MGIRTDHVDMRENRVVKRLWWCRIKDGDGVMLPSPFERDRDGRERLELGQHRHPCRRVSRRIAHRSASGRRQAVLG
jgi:hypothetical protein